MTIQELASQREKAAAVLRSLSMMNAYGRTREQIIADQARLTLARSAFEKCDFEYRTAIAKLSGAELMALAESTSPSSLNE
jgi:hypothetical protein